MGYYVIFLVKTYMRERDVNKHIEAILAVYGEDIYYHRDSPSKYGKRHVDWCGSAWGFRFVIEAKAPYEPLSGHQILTLRREFKAGTACFAIDGSEGSYDPLSNWLYMLSVKIRFINQIAPPQPMIVLPELKLIKV
jgi:hypothetical protein